MADYSQPDPVNKRVRFFDGQFLQDQDFIDDQKYHLDRERRISRLLSFSGVVEGLEVTVAGENDITIGSGAAVDALGRQLILANQVNLSLPPEQFESQADVEILLSYRESPADQAEVGGEGARRWDESPVIAARTKAGATVVFPVEADAVLDSVAVLLATVTLDNENGIRLTTATPVRAGLGVPGSVGVGTSTPSAKLEVVGDGGQSVDLVVNGQLRSDNADGGLWIARDRFVGGVDNTRVGLFNQGWGLALTAEGHVGVGTTSPANDDGFERVLDVASSQHSQLSVRTANIKGWVFAHENGFFGAPAGMGVGTRTEHPLSFATNGTTRMTIDSSGGIQIGPRTTVGLTTLNITADEQHLQLHRKTAATTTPPDRGSKIFLELFQEGRQTPNVIWPNIRFTHNNNLTHRIEAREGGFYLRHGRLDRDAFTDLHLKDLYADGAIYMRPLSKSQLIDGTKYWHLFSPNWHAGDASILGAQSDIDLPFLSDRRMKREVTELSDTVAKLTRLNGVSFSWNEQGLEYLTSDVELTVSAGPQATAEENQAARSEVRRERMAALDRRNIGLIAQDVEQVFPELVFTDASGFKSVDYTKLTAVLVQAVKEQQTAIEQLRAQLTHPSH